MASEPISCPPATDGCGRGTSDLTPALHRQHGDGRVVVTRHRAETGDINWFTNVTAKSRPVPRF